MPLKLGAFAHPEYDALRQRSEKLAFWWGVAHVFFVVFLSMAIAMPFVVGLLALISSEVSQDRLLSVGISFSAACLIISALGFYIRYFVSKKGRSS